MNTKLKKFQPLPPPMWCVLVVRGDVVLQGAEWNQCCVSKDASAQRTEDDKRTLEFVVKYAHSTT